MKLQPLEIAAFRILVAQLAWPARNSMPQISYDVSDLQQRSNYVTVGMLLKANTILRRVQGLVQQGVHLKFYSDVDLTDSVVGLVTDASFGGQPGGGNQCGYAVMWGPQAMTEENGHRSLLVDWGSARIRRVGKSALAAEACGCSTGYDCAVYLRSIITEVLGSPGRTWEERVMSVPQATLVDACSLRDHLHKTGAMPTERRVDSISRTSANGWIAVTSSTGSPPATCSLARSRSTSPRPRSSTSSCGTTGTTSRTSMELYNARSRTIVVAPCRTFPSSSTGGANRKGCVWTQPHYMHCSALMRMCLLSDACAPPVFWRRRVSTRYPAGLWLEPS